MTREEMMSLCRMVDKGMTKQVEHRHELTSGKVIACGDDCLEVEVGTHVEIWPIDECDEIMGS